MRERLDDPPSIMSNKPGDRSLLLILIRTQSGNDDGSILERDDNLGQIHVAFLASEEFVGMAVQDLPVLGKSFNQLDPCECFVIVGHVFDINSEVKNLRCLVIHFSLRKYDDPFSI